MKINEQIKENRKKVGLTQEQVANYLGVSTPAVNKWERGSTYPDISLLPALARLLKIDLNKLFSFHKELTEMEVKMFTVELVETAQNSDFRVAFEMAVEKIRQYPYCDSLLYSTANILDSFLVLSTIDKNQKEEYEKQIILWYEQVASGREEAIKISAVSKLAEKYIKSADYDKAINLIEQIPEYSIDKISFQINILIQQEKAEEAAPLLEGKLLQDIQKIQTNLFKLIDIEMKVGNQEKAKQIAEIAHSMVPLFGLWPYNAAIPNLYIAMYKKDVKQSLKHIKAILKAAHTPWNMSETPLFYRIPQEKFMDAGSYFIPAFVSELENSKEYDFLRANTEFEDILADYHITSNV